MKRAKPRGRQGVTRVASDGGHIVVSFERTALGVSKSDVESAIVAVFTRAMNRSGFATEAIQNSAENGFDFTLRDRGGIRDLELTEVVPKAAAGAVPYDAPNKVQTMGAVADLVLARVAEKAAHYAKGHTPIDLIVYPTDFKLSLPANVIALIQIALHDISTPFETVYWVEPTDIEELQLRLLWPADISHYPVDRVLEYRAREFFLVDPAAWVLGKP